LEALAQEFVVAGVRGVILIGGGEPLAHPGTAAVIETLGKAQIPVGLVTNGTMLKRNCEIIARFATWTRVSVDAASSHTYQLFRPDRLGNSKFETVISNMRELARVKKGALGFSFLLIARAGPDGTAETNFHEVVQAAELAKAIGCDYFELKAMFDMEHFIVQPSNQLRDNLVEQLDSLRTLTTERFHIVYSSTLHSLINGKPTHQPKFYTACKMAQLRTLITPSGVFVCSYHRGNDKFRIGDVIETSFVDMWKNAPADIVNPAVDCRFHCARHESNLELEYIGLGLSPNTMNSDEDVFI
jgi:sulfatase maturation enzyme AslB (radical SAM superfamily)